MGYPGGKHEICQTGAGQGVHHSDQSEWHPGTESGKQTSMSLGASRCVGLGAGRPYAGLPQGGDFPVVAGQASL